MNKNKAESFTNRPLWRILTGTVSDDGRGMLIFNIAMLVFCVGMFVFIGMELSRY